MSVAAVEPTVATSIPRPTSDKKFPPVASHAHRRLLFQGIAPLVSTRLDRQSGLERKSRPAVIVDAVRPCGQAESAAAEPIMPALAVEASRLRCFLNRHVSLRSIGAKLHSRASIHEPSMGQKTCRRICVLFVVLFTNRMMPAGPQEPAEIDAEPDGQGEGQAGAAASGPTGRRADPAAHTGGKARQDARCLRPQTASRAADPGRSAAARRRDDRCSGIHHRTA